MGVALVLLPVVSKAQDIILKTDSTIIKALVKEVNDDSIIYKSWDNQRGPDYRIAKSLVRKVSFSNGSELVVTAPAAQPSSPVVAQAPLNGALVYSRGDFSLNGKKLSSEELKAILDSQVYEETYEPATKLRTLGKVFTFVGAGVAGAGAVITMIGALSSVGKVTYYYDPNNPSKTWGHQYSDNLDKTGPVMVAGILVTSLGAALVSAGIPILIINNQRLDWVASDYNAGHRQAASFSVGATPHGFGLALNF